MCPNRHSFDSLPKLLLRLLLKNTIFCLENVIDVKIKQEVKKKITRRLLTIHFKPNVFMDIF
jgi:hypothetical protein